MNNLKKHKLLNLLGLWGIIILEIFETIYAIFISRLMPNLIGTISVILVVFVSMELNINSTHNPYVRDHHKLFSAIFFISAIISICMLLFILVENGPSSMIRGGIKGL